MRRRFSTPSEPRCRELSLRDVKRLDPIPSGFETSQVYRIERLETPETLTWTLQEAELSQPFRKVYDGGRLDEWLPPYTESVGRDALRFVAVGAGDRVDGLLTWAPQSWNNTLWLVDIRVREAERRSGLGSLLVQHLQEMARKDRFRGISVETQVNNGPAIRFYRRHGFRLSGLNDHLYTNDDLARQDVAVFLFWSVLPH